MEKRIDHEMQTGPIQGFIAIIGPQTLNPKPLNPKPDDYRASSLENGQ